MTYRIAIPDWKPTSVNSLLRSHWSRRSKIKTADADMVAVYARIAGVPQASGKRRVSISVLVKPGKGGRLPDPDNLLKSTLDALVKCGLLLDDSADRCSIGSIDVERGSETSTAIYLQDLE